MPPVTNMATAYLDARASGRALRFRSSVGAAAVAEIATRLWPVESFVHERGRTVVDGSVASGLHLSVTRDDVEEWLYEVVLLREPRVTQEEAGAAWGLVASHVWQLADE